MKKLLKSAIFIVIFIFIFLLISNLFVIKRNINWQTTRIVTGFYSQPEDSLDLIFLGTSNMASGISPMYIWSQFGFSSYSLATREQVPVLTYMFFKEALKHQKPKAVVLDCNKFFEDENEAGYYDKNETTISEILAKTPFSINKLEASMDIVQNSSETSIVDCIFPFFRFHNRWKTLTKEDFIFEDDQSSPLKGQAYFIKFLATPIEPTIVEQQTESADELPVQDYLYRIIDLCKKENVALILINIPNTPEWTWQRHQTMQTIALKNDLPFIDFQLSDVAEKCNIDPLKDYMDIKHLNLLGAEKISYYLGSAIRDYVPLKDKRENPAYTKWNSDLNDYYTVIKALRLHETDNITDYFNLLNDPNYSIFISVNDDASYSITNEEVQSMQSLGLKINLQGQFRMSYLAYIDSQEVIFEQLSNEEINFTMNGSSNQSIKMVSAGYFAGSKASILIYNTEYSLDSRGLNIVVYDKYLKKVIDSISINTFIPEHEIIRIN